MSLTFGGATSDRVDHGTGTTFTDCTYIGWFYATSDAGGQNHMGKSTAAGRHSLERKFGDVDDYNLIVDRATTDASAATTGVDRPLNAWKFIGAAYGAGGAGPRIYHGNLTTVAVEASYSAQTDGSGAVSNGSGLAFIGGNNNPFTAAFIGRIGLVMVWDRALTLGEIKAQQFNPHKTSGCILFTQYGFNGTSTQADWSGGANNGTVTGATQSSHVPLGLPFEI